SIESLDGLSAHADQGELLQWLSGFQRPPRQCYLVHGEPSATEALAAAIEERFGWSARPAGDGEEVSLA
ncbi:MAG: MBL fold metallo-hydrolase RNA specificity domain-containing protein, partial [Gemmatimonadales bacterium]